MNVLIIGNGFDIAHELPTLYTSFLSFIKFINRFETYDGTIHQFKEDNEKYCFSKLDIQVQKYISDVIEDDTEKYAKIVDIWTRKKSAKDKSKRIKHIEEMIHLSNNNLWVKWFQEQLNINPNWIDFEAEISRVVQEVESMITRLPLSVSEMPKLSNTQKFINKHIINKIDTSKDVKLVGFKEIKGKMLNDLNDLTRCLEIYLEDCVRNIDKQLLSPDIFNLRIDCLLSFNYTDTYSRLYSCKNRNIEYDYIHGKSKIDSDTENNMVLGIDDYLEGEERYRNTDFVEFKKFYQRLYKKTGCVYKKWIEKINKSNSDAIHNVYIFGHSLAMTDKDVLKEFITNEKTRITIYNFSDSQYSEQIINLVHLIGPDELNAMVYGANPKIVFKRQAEMISITDSEWEILNDRNQLYNIHNLGNAKILNLIKKIKDKLDSSDTIYFHNQDNLISLYNAIVANCYRDFGLHDDFIRIAEQLYNPESYIIFDPNDWIEPDYTGTVVGCYIATEHLIHDINTLNRNMKSKVDDTIYSDDIDELLKSLIMTDLSEEKALDLFNTVFNKFESDSDDCRLIWKCINKIQEKQPNYDWKQFFNTKIKTANPIDKIRYRRLLDIIDEQEYFEDMARRQEEYEECD